MNKPASELIALADDYLRVDRAKLAEWADDFEAAAHEVPRGIKSTILMTRAQEVRAALATPPAQPAPAATHGKPDGAVREALCCSSISPCEYQRTHRTGVCETCQKAAALSPKIATAETSPGDVIAMKEVLGHIRTAILEARLEVVTDTLWMPERLSKNETVVDYIAAAIARLDVKAEAKSQEPEAVAYLPFDAPLWRQYEHRIKRLMADVGMPNSTSLKLAMDQLTRDVEHIAANRATTHPATKPEAPAVSVDAIAGLITDNLELDWHGREAAQKTRGAVNKAATAIAALIAGER